MDRGEKNNHSHLGASLRIAQSSGGSVMSQIKPHKNGAKAAPSA